MRRSNLAKFALTFQRSVRTFQNLDGRPRDTSFPFISGDTYRSIADVYFDLELWSRIRNGSRVMPQNLLDDGSIVFVECILLRDPAVESALRQWVAATEGSVRLKFIFANGDEPPNLGFRQFLQSRGHSIFSHNVMDGENGVTPIPLGLQNATHRRFGVTNDFLLSLDESRNPPVRPRRRDIFVYGNFSVGSNPDARGPLKSLLEKSRFGFVDTNLSVRENRFRMLRAKFVPSPAGLGPDCYRTWEALYLGSVPVVLGGTLASSITEGMPLWVVESWDELIFATDEELDAKFLAFSAVGREKTLFPYWQALINGNSLL